MTVKDCRMSTDPMYLKVIFIQENGGKMISTNSLKSVIGILLPKLVKSVANKMNGYKTMTGVILTTGGMGMLFFHGGEAEAVTMLISGAPTLLGGIIHKIIKRKNRGQE